MAFQGPPPKTSKEYLIRIYDMVHVIDKTVARVCETQNEHGGRIESLEKTREQGKTVWSVSRGLLGLFALVSAASGAIAGALAGLAAFFQSQP